MKSFTESNLGIMLFVIIPSIVFYFELLNIDSIQLSNIMENHLPLISSLLLAVLIFIFLSGRRAVARQTNKLLTDIEVTKIINERKIQFLYDCIKAGQLLEQPASYLTDKEIELFSYKATSDESNRNFK